LSGTSLRPAGLADLPALLALETEFPGDRMSAPAWRRLLRSPTAEVRVALDEGEVVGNCVLLFRRHSRWARLYSIVIAQRARGRGLAQALMREAETLAWQRGCIGLRRQCLRETPLRAAGLCRDRRAAGLLRGRW
jgi:[ribosomal protein S18]-alanine N-acetyltransferase